MTTTPTPTPMANRSKIHNQRSQAHVRVLLHVREYDDDPSKQDPFHQHHDSIPYDDYQVTTTTTTTSIQSSSSSSSSFSSRRWLRTPVRVVKDLFLPVGYPSSVHDGYLEYQCYDSLQGLCSYLRGVLCSAQVLQAAGVGTAEATALSAALTWALKDGLSMMGGLLFSYTTAPLFDTYVKEFRLFADLINDVGLTLDMMAPFLARASSLLLVSSAAGLCKTLCGLSAAATKSSITQHFALEGNMADLNAKESTQETLVSLLGMLLGVTLAHSLLQLPKGDDNQGLGHIQWQVQWVVFIVLTFLHVWANWRGVSILRLRTLNPPRARVVLDHLVQVLVAATATAAASTPMMTPRQQVKVVSTLLETALASESDVPAPPHVYESLFWSSIRLVWPGRIRTAARFPDIVRAMPTNRNAKDDDDDAASSTLLQHVLDDFAEERYWLVVSETDRNQPIYLTLLVGATPRDQLQALLHALVLDACLDRCTTTTTTAVTATATATTTAKPTSVPSSPTPTELVTITRTLVKLVFPTDDDSSPLSLMKALSNRGWDVERVYLGFSRQRLQWSIGKEE